MRSLFAGVEAQLSMVARHSAGIKVLVGELVHKRAYRVIIRAVIALVAFKANPRALDSGWSRWSRPVPQLQAGRDPVWTEQYKHSQFNSFYLRFLAIEQR